MIAVAIVMETKAATDDGAGAAVNRKVQLPHSPLCKIVGLRMVVVGKAAGNRRLSLSIIVVGVATVVDGAKHRSNRLLLTPMAAAGSAAATKVAVIAAVGATSLSRNRLPLSRVAGAINPSLNSNPPRNRKATGVDEMMVAKVAMISAVAMMSAVATKAMIGVGARIGKLARIAAGMIIAKQIAVGVLNAKQV
jgi:hypothetical protein